VGKKWPFWIRKVHTEEKERNQQQLRGGKRNAGWGGRGGTIDRGNTRMWLWKRVVLLGYKKEKAAIET